MKTESTPFVIPAQYTQSLVSESMPDLRFDKQASDEVYKHSERTQLVTEDLTQKNMLASNMLASGSQNDASASAVTGLQYNPSEVHTYNSSSQLRDENDALKS